MIITKTPYRISFVGGGTDMADYYRNGYGAVVSAAIGKYMYITVNKRFDDSIRVSYSKTEIVDSVDEIKHELVRECMKMTGVSRGVEITSIGEVPEGTGLGSSSSFTVGLLNALYTYRGYHLSARELAEKACEIEINILGHPIGKQDQYAAAYGGLHYFMFHQDGQVDVERIRMQDREFKKMHRKLMLFYTGIRRSANDVLTDQKEGIPDRVSIMDEMRDYAAAMQDMLNHEGFGPGFAKMLNENWEKKRKLSGKISSREIDAMYENALNAGALGGKLLGAGGGGFLLLYCDEEKQEDVRRALDYRRELDFSIALYGSRVVYFA